MGERKGQNKYYPPDFDYKTHKSLDRYHGTHPLRERAKKIHEGILVIRFEMPYNIWCEGCNNHIGMGVRYNAEKSKVGNYYSTPIYQFRMKCHLCDQYFEIKTDPANHDYVIMSGARRKEQRWDPKENEQIVPEDKATQKKLATDAMYKLEHGFEDKVKTKKTVPGLAQLEELQSRSKDDYLLNQLARSKFRSEKKALKVVADEDSRILEKSSLDLDLVEEIGADVRMAKLLKYHSLKTYDERQKEKRSAIQNSSIFSSTKAQSSSRGKVEHDSFSIGNGASPFTKKSATSLGIVRKNKRPRINTEASSDEDKCEKEMRLTSEIEETSCGIADSNSSNTSGTTSQEKVGDNALLSLQGYDSASTGSDEDAAT